MEAGPLSYWLPLKPSWLDAALRVKIASRVANALVAMHDLRWVHRDVKSANVLLSRSGEAVLGDTGLAKQADRVSDGYSPGGTGIGTLGYMCPDYKRTGVLKASADVYGLGVLLVELLTGCVAQATREQEASNVRSLCFTFSAPARCACSVRLTRPIFRLRWLAASAPPQRCT